MNYKIRKIKKDDCKNISHVVTISWNETYKDIVPKWFLDELKKNEEERANQMFVDFENNNYTLGALKNIIKYAKANGYTFDKITENTKEVHHRVNN